jgi:TatD DNase family protein
LARLVDSHCHLNLDIFHTDREAVICRALEQGIERIVVPGIDLETSRSAINLAQAYPGLIYAAVGSHPNEREPWEEEMSQHLRELIDPRWVVAVGEIGLDYYRDHTPRKVQQVKFKEQLSLAGKLSLPVIIHNRDAMEDMLPILSEWFASLVESGSKLNHRPGILHSFEGCEAQALELIKMNFLIGISGPVTFKNAVAKQSMIARLPLTYLVTETDAPYLTPLPFRGQRNEPKNIYYITEKIAQLHQVPLPDAAEQVMRNADRVFSWGN